jgi:hypothetical protein
MEMGIFVFLGEERDGEGKGPPLGATTGCRFGDFAL